MSHKDADIVNLGWEERLHYRDRLRAARYAALADAEGFGEICFAVEALGLRLSRCQGDMWKYKVNIHHLSLDSLMFTELSSKFPGFFSRFDALYETVREARNDAMHTGAYARHATSAAIELCTGLEEALMGTQETGRITVADFMVKASVSIEPWQPVAYARQLMLMHSFSFLPVFMEGGWKLVSELAMAKYLNKPNAEKKKLLANSIDDASKQSECGLQLIEAKTVQVSEVVSEIFKNVTVGQSSTLWLAVDENKRLVGVLSPFELM